MEISELETVDLNPFTKLSHRGTEIAFEKETYVIGTQMSKKYYRILRSDNDSNYNNLQKELESLSKVDFLDKKDILLGTRDEVISNTELKEVSYLLLRELG